ncbi:cytotoxic translational repressor of toxin-antitoxin stability system [Haloferax sp. Atlit-10N]|uniref:type II toxin-antitoxin system RelE family toxin n=1 Tax=unclassified Haloferax TaxID=2625095 RepID=UPI000E2591F4|nr:MULTISPECIES: type II toxin-antitoxin system RelE/ParE family toxin [unclassified Haloferax]RDZ39568.1 cytotoxic translational repressor of toxin-antitoxin stability system [Haloferax sp. Atlit-16N]RDZ55985.1 cytotoxic translational repressor of toxin-antitoxin stability system [Haloferax sp. Atlit-10N]
MTEIEWTPKAIELLEGLDTKAQERLVKKLDEAKDWTSHRVEKLTGYPYYKLRAGDYRAIITWNRDQDVLIVEAVGHRRNIYDRHLPP